MENKAKTTATKRRRSSNRIGASCGQPVHIGFYLNSVLNENGRTDRKKIIELFNKEYYG